MMNNKSPPLLPVRMLNEFSYCPRLFYLEWVQGEFAHNDDTLEGEFVHHRVDKESGNIGVADGIEETENIHARSVSLSSDNCSSDAVLNWHCRSIMFL